MSKYSVGKIKEFVQLCKIEPRRFEITELNLLLYYSNNGKFLPYLTLDEYSDLLDVSLNMIKKDPGESNYILVFFSVLVLRNGYDTRPFFKLIELLETLKRRVGESIVRAWIYDLSTDYAHYIEIIDKYHPDLEKIYNIKTSNRESHEGYIEKASKTLQVEVDVLYNELSRIPNRLQSHKVNEITKHIDDFLIGKEKKLHRSVKQLSAVHGIVASVFYYMVRDIIYKEEKYQDEIIETIIAGMEELVDYYKERFHEFNPSGYLRFVTFIAAKNSLKLRYNEDNNIDDIENILKDYTEDLIFVYNSRLYETNIGTSVKFLQEIYILQELYNMYNIKANVYKQFEHVLVFLTTVFNIDLLNMSMDREDVKTFVMEGLIPGLGVCSFFRESSDATYDMFGSAIVDYYNLFNDNYNERQKEYRKFDLSYVYDVREKNETN